jgi:predicted Zn-dependent protease
MTQRVWTVALLANLLVLPPALAQEPFTPFMSPAEEMEVGRKEHPKILAQFGGVHDDPNIGGYVAVVGGSLVANSGQARYPFSFTVLNSSVVNAFALPGGYVYVTRGLLALANSEAELAGVLAHEIGHVTARHAAQRYSRNVIAGLGAALLGALTDSDELSSIAQVGSQLYLSGFSRDQEYESDLLGVRYMSRTGYNPRAQASFLATLRAEHELNATVAGRQGADEGFDFFASHPRTADRVAAAVRAADQSGLPPDAPLRRDEYLRAIDGLLYGDDPAQGFVRGRVFAHPGIGFTFEVPAGFRLLNDSQAVLAQGPRGAVIRFDGEKRQRRGSMAAYLTRVWVPKARPADVQTFDLDGMELATGSARVQGASGPLDVRFVAIRYNPDQIYRFLLATPPQATRALQREMLRAALSFRRLNHAEAARYKPRRLQMVRVEPGQSAAGLASFMAVDDYPLERFRVLNALAPGDTLAVGRVVKLVRE